ncbi:MAG: D-sedoheptulose 7-phosphate isomerase [Bacteroidota bacterium]
MIIKKNIQDALSLKQQLLTNEELHKQIEAISDLVVKCYQQGGKVLFCGNGGSAADSQHLAAELSGRYYYDRPPLSAEALHVNTSYLTAVANDYSYDEVYARLVKAVGKPGDVIFGLSTSGNSQNVLNAFTVANEIGFTSIAMTGEGGGKMKDAADFLVAIPSKDTPRIQECHMLIGHTICQLVEQTLFPND